MEETSPTQVQIAQVGHTLVLTLHGPHSRNAVSPSVYSAVQDALVSAAADSSIRAIVLYGANGFFSSGGDVNNLKKSAQQPMHEVTRNTDRLNTMIKWLRTCPKPIVAAVEGGAAGAGVSIMLACDLIVAAKASKFTLAYVRIGLTPDGGVTHFLSKALPRQMIAEMCFLGRPVSAENFEKHGLINRLVPAGAVLDEAMELAGMLEKGPQEAMAVIKELIEDAGKNDLATHLDREAVGINRARYSPEAREGINAFLEKRTPDFSAKD